MPPSNKRRKHGRGGGTSRIDWNSFEPATDDGINVKDQDDTEVPTMADIDELSPEDETYDLIEDSYPEETPMAADPSNTSVLGRLGSSDDTHANGLFAMLSKLEGVSGSKAVRIRPHPSGHPIGTVSIDNGVITDARLLNSKLSVTHALEKQYPKLEKKIRQVRELARATQKSEINILVQQGFIPEDDLVSAHRKFIIGEILKMVDSGAGWNAVIEFTGSESTAYIRFGITPLQLMLGGIAYGVPKVVKDVAWKFFDNWADKADGALLLFRPNNRSYLPVPARIEGLEGTKLSELRAICRSAGEMCQPAKFTVAGATPLLTTFTSKEASWICAAGPIHYVLLRLSQRAHTAMAIGSIFRLMKEVEVD
ncbi:MAG: hypothetical protein L3J82_03530 [Planctomycetes bacterium]|nr:hypothetical protein [Planctomycetota bacterium]